MSARRTENAAHDPSDFRNTLSEKRRKEQAFFQNRHSPISQEKSTGTPHPRPVLLMYDCHLFLFTPSLFVSAYSI